MREIEAREREKEKTGTWKWHMCVFQRDKEMYAYTLYRIVVDVRHKLQCN